MGIFQSSLHKKEQREENRNMAKAIVDEAIAANSVMVFSKSYCPYCIKAKRALESVLPREKISVMELESRADCADIQDYLMSITGGRSVPRVFVPATLLAAGTTRKPWCAAASSKRCSSRTISSESD